MFQSSSRFYCFCFIWILPFFFIHSVRPWPLFCLWHQVPNLKPPNESCCYQHLSSVAEDTRAGTNSQQEIQESLQHQIPRWPKQISANGRAVLRKHFAETALISLPLGHSKIAFSEPQVHTVLKTTSEETVKSSYHMMRYLIMQNVYGGVGQTPTQFRKAFSRGKTPARTFSESSASETEGKGYSSDGYTSGALASNENLDDISQTRTGDLAPSSATVEPTTGVREGRIIQAPLTLPYTARVTLTQSTNLWRPSVLGRKANLGFPVLKMRDAEWPVHPEL